MLVRHHVLFAAVLAGSALTGGVRADALDVHLNKAMPEVVEQLKKRYKNVGVLRFRVQEGSQKDSFTSPLSGRMAQRVETLLVVHAGEEEGKALGVIRDAGKAAARANIQAWWTSPADRKKLFETSYPLAWGSKTVKPDAFLTGKVQLSKDLTRTTVTLEYFDKSDPATLKTLSKATRTADTDRFVLRDLGHGLDLSKLVTKRGADQDNKYAVRAVRLNQQGQLSVDVPPDPKAEKVQPEKTQPEKAQPEKAQPKKAQPQKTQEQQPPAAKPNAPSPRDVAGLQVELVVDKKVVEFSPAPSDGQAVKWLVQSPDEGQDVGIRLRNTTDKWLGVVLRLNGVSTINEQTGEPATSNKWMVPPGKSYLIKGFYTTDLSQGGDGAKTPSTDLKKFKVLAGDDAKAFADKMSEEMAPKKGLIEVDVFEEGEAGGQPEEMLISMRGLPPSAERKARASYPSLKAALLRSARLKATSVTRREGSLVIKREMIVPDEAAIAADKAIQRKDMKNPRFAGGVSIRVLPKGTPKSDE